MENINPPCGKYSVFVTLNQAVLREALAFVIAVQRITRNNYATTM